MFGCKVLILEMPDFLVEYRHSRAARLTSMAPISTPHCLASTVTMRDVPDLSLHSPVCESATLGSIRCLHTNAVRHDKLFALAILMSLLHPAPYDYKPTIWTAAQCIRVDGRD